MRAFLSPAERMTLELLPPDEAAFVREFMDMFDAVLVGGSPLSGRN